MSTQPHVDAVTACPTWCTEVTHRLDRRGESCSHTGAGLDLGTDLGCWVWKPEDGPALVYVADGDATPQQARQLAAGLLKAADLAQRIGSAQP